MVAFVGLLDRTDSPRPNSVSTPSAPSTSQASSTRSETLMVDLEKYGNAVSVTTDGTVKFVSARQTTESPTNAFQLKFETDDAALMSGLGAESGNAAYLTNVGITRAWSVRFCTDELKAIMSRYRIDLVTGNLTNLEGKTQRMSIC